MHDHHPRPRTRSTRATTHGAAVFLATLVVGALLAIPTAVALALAVRVFRSVAGL